jgi:iron complex outermembrane receptor protein
MKHRFTLLALAAMATCAQAQTTGSGSAPAAEPQRIEVTGSLIKRTDRETPSVVEVFTRDDIVKSGFATVEEFLKSKSFVDASSIQDGYGTGFVSGLSTLSMRGMGSQSTLVLINGRRIAPVAAVDINFGRGSLISVNTIPQGAIDRIEVLKDGASAMYGSDAMAGVVNYVLRKEYNGFEALGSYSANEWGAGAISRGSLTFGFGNLERQKFNVYGGLEVSKRDSVMASELKNLGDLTAYNKFQNDSGFLARFSPASANSFWANYYRVPTAFPATVVNSSGQTVLGNSTVGPLYLGSLPGCPDANTVGKGVPTRLPGYVTSTPSMPVGMCRFFSDDALEYIAAQDRLNGSVRATYQFSPQITAYADLMVSRTETREKLPPYVLTPNLVRSVAPTAVTWPMLNGTFKSQNAIILPVGHPDNPTNGTATAQPVQLLYRFEDIPQLNLQSLNSTRLVAGAEGTMGAWDFDAAVMYSKQDNEAVRTNRVRSSLLNAAIASGSYRFGKANDAAAIASVSTDAVNTGSASILAIDARGSREVFQLSGGQAVLGVGVEARREKLESVPDANYLSGDYIGLVANGTSGSRDSLAAYGELRLPVLKELELQAALRTENYTDFGNATTGKLGFKWDAIKSMLVFRGTGATGFRAPSISQISNAFLMSFHSSQEKRLFDSLRCDSSNPANPVSKANPANTRDCNVLGFTNVPPGLNPGNLPTVVSANPNLKPETSKSFTLGLILTPMKEVDLTVDGWYFERNNEVRVQRGQDIMDAYNASPAANAQYLIRDPNPATWLPGVANSGPILALVRQYGNFNYTKTAGIDYDLNVRLPKSDLGQFRLNLTGTYTRRYDQQILAGTPYSSYPGTAIVVEVPKSRGSVRVDWAYGPFNSWARYNHIDAMAYSGTASCAAATSGPNLALKESGRCGLGAEASVDVGLSYTGVKNLTVAASILNLLNSYDRAIQIPSAFSFWDSGLQAQLGRRFSVTASYRFN